MGAKRIESKKKEIQKQAADATRCLPPCVLGDSRCKGRGAGFNNEAVTGVFGRSSLHGMVGTEAQMQRPS